jgi:hypothetical protein
MGTKTTKVQGWAPQPTCGCSCDFGHEWDDECEALAPVAKDARPAAERPASARPVRMGLISVVDVPEALRRQEAQFDDVRE